MRVRLPDGTDTRRRIGKAWRSAGRPPAGFYTERTARAELEKLLAKYDGYTEDSDPLFKVAAEEFLSHCAEMDRKKTTIREYERIIQTRLLPALGEKPLSRISEQDVVSLRGDLRELSASSLNQTRIVLSGVIRWARKSRRYRGEDFSEFFDRARVKQKTHIDVYSPAEIELIARTLREGRHRGDPDRGFVHRSLTAAEILENRRMDDQDAVIAKTAAYAGLRMSEVRALRWRDVDFAGAKITVRAGYTDAGKTDTPKSGKARTIPMASRLAAEVDHLSRREHFISEDDLVFCNVVGDVLSASGIYHRFVAGAREAGLRRLTFHSLRHAFCSMAVQMFPLTDVQAYAGHADISTTMKYVHFIPRHGDAAKMDELLDTKLGANLDIAQLVRAANS